MSRIAKPQPDLARRLVAAVLVAAPVAAGTLALAGETVSGPIEADVVRVIDGDTFVADAHVWPGQVITVSVRVRGIDAPELHSSCAEERVAARRSRDALAELISGASVTISNIGGGKYYGRVLADVSDHFGRRIADVMLARKLARAYEGGKRVSGCDEAGRFSPGS